NKVCVTVQSKSDWVKNEWKIEKINLNLVLLAAA
ncbi:MAG: hypothetical protein ACJA0W_001811, partial [Candidatus Azotimanducaceae bacterium]